MVVGHVHELDGHGDSQGVVQEFMLARWDTRTGDLFVEDGDRVSGGPWDHYRNTARANKDALDRLAEYGMAKGREYVVHTEIPRVARARHFKITAEG